MLLGGVAHSATPDSTFALTDSTRAPAQRDIMDVARGLFDKRVEPQIEGAVGPGIIWTILPSFSYNPVYGLALGASLSGAGRLGDGPKSKPSVVSISGNYSTTGQLQLQFKGDIFTPAGNYLIKPDVRYLDTERSTWGLGPVSETQQEFPMEYKLSRLYATLYRRTGEEVFVGVGYHLDTYDDIVDQRAVAGDSTPYTEYNNGTAPGRSRAAGFSLNLLADTRDNIVNPKNGMYLSGTFRDYLEVLGSDNNWQEFWAEIRLYPQVPRRTNNVLAFWLYSWFTFGNPPFLDLPSIGWDTYGRGGRGYLQGRIRGRNQIYLESEYRMQLTRNGLLGAVAFLDLTWTTNEAGQTFGRTDKGGGAGLRIKLNKRSDTNITIDHGWGEQGSRGWFFGTTEIF